MSRTELLSGLPVYKSGTNVGNLNRTLAANLLGLTKEELSKAYNNWIQIFRIDGSSLTFVQYLDKMKEADIGPYDVGNSIDQYHLSRYNDVGPYTNESCRFLLKKENLFEQKKVSPYLRVVYKYGEEVAKKIARENGRKGLDTQARIRTASING